MMNPEIHRDGVFRMLGAIGEANPNPKNGIIQPPITFEIHNLYCSPTEPGMTAPVLRLEVQSSDSEQDYATLNMEIVPIEN